MATRALSRSRLLVAALACGLTACALQPTGLGDDPADGSASNAIGPVEDAHGGAVLGDATAPTDAGAPPRPAPDTGTPIVDPPADATSPVPDVAAPTPDASPADAGDPCDLDGDGHRATGECGGDDCCDYDARAFPGQTSFFSTPDGCGSFDYDCNGESEPETGVASCKLGVFACSGDGFTNPTACGASGEFTSCHYAIVTCSRSTDTRTQSCR